MTVLWEQEFLWTPKTKDRPRAQPGGKGRSYTPQATVDAERNLLDQYEGPCFDQFLAVEYSFFNDRIVLTIREGQEHTQRKLRGDTDNYLKLAVDALNTHAWTDDRLIVDLRGFKN